MNRVRALTKISNGVLAQALNTVGNVVLSLSVARSSAPDEYGAWAIAYGIYVLCLGITKSTVSTALLIDTDAGVLGFRRAAIENVSAAFVISCFFSVTLLLAALLTGGSVRHALVIFAVLLPGLLIQDALRYIFIKMSKPALTLVLDTSWLLLQLTGFGVLIYFDAASMVSLTVVWGVGGWTVAVVACLAARVGLSLGRAIAFFVRSRVVTGKLLVDSMLSSGTVALVPIAIGAVVSLDAVGYYRAGLTLLGPVGLLVAGVSPFLTVAAAGKVNSFKVAARTTGKWTVLLTVIAGPYCLALALLPDRIGQLLLGEVWFGVSGMLVVFALHGAIRGPQTAVPILLRASKRLDSLIKLRLFTTIPHLVLPVACGAVWGFPGVVWGAVVGVISANIQCLLTLRVFRC